MYDKEYREVKRLLTPLRNYIADSELDEDVKAGIACFCILELIDSFSITMKLGILERAKNFLQEEADEPEDIVTGYIT